MYNIYSIYKYGRMHLSRDRQLLGIDREAARYICLAWETNQKPQKTIGVRLERYPPNLIFLLGMRPRRPGHS